MLKKRYVLHEMFSEKEKKYLKQPSSYSVYHISNNKEIGGAIITVVNNNIEEAYGYTNCIFVSEIDYKKKSKLYLLIQDILESVKEYNQSWGTNYNKVVFDVGKYKKSFSNITTNNGKEFSIYEM